MKELAQAYCLDDEVYYSDNVSAVFEIDGERVYLVKSYDDYLELKREVTVTHKIGGFEPYFGLYKCDLHGSDGSMKTIYVTPEDVYHNMRVTERELNTQESLMIC
jgi:hypothetical protein